MDRGWPCASCKIPSEAVRCAAARVEDDDLRVVRHFLIGDESLEHRERAAAFGRRVDAGGEGESLRAGANGLLADGPGVAAALAQRAQDEAVAERAGHAQPAGVRLGILPWGG